MLRSIHTHQSSYNSISDESEIVMMPIHAHVVGSVSDFGKLYLFVHLSCSAASLFSNFTLMINRRKINDHDGFK